MSLFRNLIDGLFPSICHICHNPQQGSEGVCLDCLADYPFISLKQPNLLFQPDIARMFNLPYCHGLLACSWYQGHMQTWLKEFKFSKQSFYQNCIGSVIKTQLAHFNQTRIFMPDLILILPLHNRRLINRGFNQVAQTWLPYLPKEQVSLAYLVRSRSTKAQSGLNLKQRTRNVKHVFTVNGDLKGKKVAIIDDVITTGATINAAAKACYAAGATEIWAYATALTPLHGQRMTKK